MKRNLTPAGFKSREMLIANIQAAPIISKTTKSIKFHTRPHNARLLEHQKAEGLEYYFCDVQLSIPVIIYRHSEGVF